MNVIDQNALNIHPLARSDIDLILDIWWHDVPEQDKKRLASQLGGGLQIRVLLPNTKAIWSGLSCPSYHTWVCR